MTTIPTQPGASAGEAELKNKEQRIQQLTLLLQRPFQGPLETLAEKNDLSMKEVVECLPSKARHHIPGEHCIQTLEEIAQWGEILLIIHNENGVFECKGRIVAGSIGMGYYNLGHGSTISGHLRYDRCRDIYCVRRQFHKLETCSVQFFNAQGECMFKVFVGRGEDRELKPDQVRRFEALSSLVDSQ